MIRKIVFNEFDTIQNKCWLTNYDLNEMPLQNLNQSKGPLVIYTKADCDSSATTGDDIIIEGDPNLDSVDKLKLSLPNKVKSSIKSIIDEHELFHTKTKISSQTAGYNFDTWVSLFASIFGKDKFDLNNGRPAKEIGEQMKQFPNQKIDKCRSESMEGMKDRLKRGGDEGHGIVQFARTNRK